MADFNWGAESEARERHINELESDTIRGEPIPWQFITGAKEGWEKAISWAKAQGEMTHNTKIMTWLIGGVCVVFCLMMILSALWQHDNETSPQDWVTVDRGIDYLHPVSGTFSTSAREFNALVAAQKAQDQVEQAELMVVLAGFVKITMPSGKVMWRRQIERVQGASRFQPGLLIFFGHPIIRVEADPETGLISIYTEVAPVESH